LTVTSIPGSHRSALSGGSSVRERINDTNAVPFLDSGDNSNSSNCSNNNNTSSGSSNNNITLTQLRCGAALNSEIGRQAGKQRRVGTCTLRNAFIALCNLPPPSSPQGVLTLNTFCGPRNRGRPQLGTRTVGPWPAYGRRHVNNTWRPSTGRLRSYKRIGATPAVETDLRWQKVVAVLRSARDRAQNDESERHPRATPCSLRESPSP
jgi:hypothetical protein